MFYSHSTKGFYCSGIYSEVPGDAIELTDAEYAAMQAAPSSMIGIGDDGKPFIAESTDPAFKPAHTQCTPAQGLVALFALKQITEEHVLEAIAQIPDPVQQYTARIGYQRATVWERGSQTMQSMAQLLQLSEVDLDALFTHAVTVKV